MLNARRRRAVSALGALFGLALCLAPQNAAHAKDPFPEYEAIQGNVEFWIRAFSEWTLGQAAVHDLRHPELVYEVVDLPGDVIGGYTKEQRDYLEQVREGWKDYLAYIEGKAARGDELSDLEKSWVLHIVEVIGPDGLAGAHERVRTQRGLRERFREGLERAARYEGLIRDVFRAHGLPEDLAFLPHVESSFQYHARSSAGATGLWQFTRGTGRHYMTINSTLDERLDPVAATRGAALYLRDAYDKLETWPLALTSYNHGVQGMLKAKERFGTDFAAIYEGYDGRVFGFASKNFYAEFLAAREIARATETYFPEGFDPEPSFDLDNVILEQKATAKSIARVYEVDLDELVDLNPAWSSRAAKRGAAIPEGTQVWLPAGKLEQLTQGGIPLPAPPGIGVAQTYVVRRGDTLSGIAKSNRVTVSLLRDLNDIPRSESLIRPGQTLILAVEEEELVHVVQRGDTLTEIAAAYGVTLGALRDANEISRSSSMIRAGQELRLPTGAVYREPNRKHVVLRGDTLLEIALRYGIRLTDLLRVNTLSTDSIIRPGQTLSIP
jgi:membrane-bound lytic murein transglycosylase D